MKIRLDVPSFKLKKMQECLSMQGVLFETTTHPRNEKIFQIRFDDDKETTERVVNMVEEWWVQQQMKWN
jgi:hypothetical protein